MAVFLFYYRKYYSEIGPFPLFIFYIALLFLSLFSLEFILSGLDFFESDEVSYLHIGSGIIEWPSGPDRSLWFLTNYLLLNYDVSFNGIALKLINIPIAACFLMVLWFIFRDKKIFLLPIILPYFAIVATKNFRDIPILLFTALTVLLFHHPKLKLIILSLTSLAMLFLLRPFAAVIVFIILLFQMFFSTLKSFNGTTISKKYARKILILALISLTISPFVMSSIQTRIDQYYRWFIYTTFDVGREMLIQERVQGDPRYASGNRIRDFGVAGVRYAATPIPTSIFKRLLDGGTGEWGVIDDLIRFLNQVGFYFLTGYLIVNVRFILTAFRQMPTMGRGLVLCLLTNWPIYSFYLYGVGHQRNKIPFQIVFFLIAISISKHKQYKHY